MRDLCKLADMCMRMGVVFECRMIPTKKEVDNPGQSEKPKEGNGNER